MATKPTDQYSAKEAAARFEAALRGGMGGSPKPHDEMKLGKPRGKKVASPKNRARKSQAK